MKCATEFTMFLLITLDHHVPVTLGFSPALDALAKLCIDLVRHVKTLVLRPAEIAFCFFYSVRPRRVGVSPVRALLWHAVSDYGVDTDEGRAALLRLSFLDRFLDRTQIAAVEHFGHVPARGLEAFRSVLGKR